jgi:acyl-coenzyme A synthetase/AMP-(fatty) acid ligase
MHDEIFEGAAVGIPHEVSGEIAPLFAVRHNERLPRLI